MEFELGRTASRRIDLLSIATVTVELTWRVVEQTALTGMPLTPR